MIGTIGTREREALRRALAGLAGEVRLLVFTDRAGGRAACPFCEETVRLAEELAAASGRVRLEVHDLREEQAVAAAHGVERVPALVLLGADGRDPGIRFLGIPAGFELATVIQALALLASGEHGLRPATAEALAGLEREVRIRVFVTPTCPYCPRAALTAMRMAMGSDRVRAEVVEVSEFPDLGDRYGVYGVPKTVVDDAVELEGAAPEEVVLEAVLRAAGRGER